MVLTGFYQPVKTGPVFTTLTLVVGNVGQELAGRLQCEEN